MNGEARKPKLQTEKKEYLKLMNRDIEYTALLNKQIETLKHENRYLEFKSNYQEPDKLGRYISALSNGACLDNKDMAYLYFGVDDATLTAKGNQALEMYLRQMVSPKNRRIAYSRNKTWTLRNTQLGDV